MCIVFSASQLLAIGANVLKRRPAIPLQTIRTLRPLNICASNRTHRGTSAGFNLSRPIPVVTSYGRGQLPRIIPTSKTTAHTNNASSTVHRPPFNTNMIRVPLISSSLIRNGNDMRVCYFNAQSVCNKTLPISDIICECDFDVIAITETWLKSTIDATTVRELTPKGYSHKLLSRSSRKGGGVARCCTNRLLTLRSQFTMCIVRLST